MWNLKTDDGGKRLYVNSLTNGQCEQTMVKVDKDGNKWWSFNNLMALPFTRNFAATKISSLYTLGLSKVDLDTFISTHKATLKSSDSEKYERAYAETLDFESKAKNATDAVKQMSSLVCVYYTLNDEPIDSFENNLQLKKLGILEADIELHSFFLNDQTEAIGRYMNHFALLSQIVSQPMVGQ